jgi:type I restriction enzyme, S subunit
MRLKYLTKHIDERHVQSDTELLSVSKIKGVVPRSEVSDNPGRADDISHYKTCKPGDLVINRMAAYQGALGIATMFGAISPDYMVLRFRNTLEPRFVGYLFKSSYMANEMSSRVKGIGSIDSGSVRTPRLSWTDLGEVDIQVPPIKEQQAIADFLDRELAEIDQLIDTQDGLIALLGKRRQSAITSAVTNGLAADVETESSGNHWLGKIPSHWTMKPLKYLVSLNPTALPESTSDEFEFNYIEISDVTKEHGVKGSSRQRFSTAPSRARRLVQENDVLVSTVRTYLRAVGLVPEVQDGLPFVASTGFAALRPTGVNPNFLSYALTAEHFVAQVESRSTGISYPAINASDLVSIAIPVPPFEEQIQIARHLDNQLTQLDALVSVTKEAIERLYERRSAVVSAAVTGKVDVWGKN